jgi:hypothetical protein
MLFKLRHPLPHIQESHRALTFDLAGPRNRQA